MAIERDRSDRFLVCDNCSESGEYWHSDDFNGMISKAQRDGWTIRKNRGEWEHFCPKCPPDKNLTAKSEFKRQ